MGWLPQSEFDRLEAEAKRLSPKERESLTWEDARRFVAADTMDMAMWQGLRKSGRTPWQAVAALRGIEESSAGEMS